LSGQTGAPYIIQTATNLTGSWIPVGTNILTGNAMTLTNVVASGTQFWRAIWLP
jgi:hypothetical protein